MLTVITGLPGSGKTASCVERILMPMQAKDWKEQAITSDGEAVTVTRRLFTNVKGLLLEHELIEDAELMRWPEWVKPGDLIVFDEVQKPWPLTGANKEQPKCITELETHRHYGIDMVLLTQHPMLINSAICRLAGQHLHVRKLGNSRFATIYEWDGVSRTLQYKSAFSKKAWRRGKAVEQVYRSSSLHTKQKRAMPSVLWGVLFAGVLMALLGPTAYGRISDRVAGTSSVGTQKVAAAPMGTASAPKPPQRPASAPEAPMQGDAPAPLALAAASAPAMATSIGCIRMANRCRCFESSGAAADKPAEFCEELTGINAPAKLADVVRPDWEPPQPAVRIQDLELQRAADRLLDQRRAGRYAGL